MKLQKQLKTLCIVSALSLSAAFAQNQPQRPQLNAEQKQKMDQSLQKQLGITGEQFHNCLEANRPAPGVKPSEGDRESGKGAILACLQKYNPSLTKEQAQNFMQSHRPPHPPRGERNEGNSLKGESSNTFR